MGARKVIICRDCGVRMEVWHASQRTFCDPCGKNHSKQAKKETHMTLEEVEAYLERASHDEWRLHPAWERK